MTEYPKLSLNEKIRGGYKYSYRYLLSVPYITIGAFEASVNLNITRIEKKFPFLQLQIARVIVDTMIPDKVDFVFTFSQEPSLTHNQFSEEIRSVAKETYWGLDLQEVVLLKKPFPWFWGGAGLLFLFLMSKEG